MPRYILHMVSETLAAPSRALADYADLPLDAIGSDRFPDNVDSAGVRPWRRGLQPRLRQVEGMAHKDTRTGSQHYLSTRPVRDQLVAYMPPNPPERKDLMGSTVDFAACLESVASSSFPESDILPRGRLVWSIRVREKWGDAGVEDEGCQYKYSCLHF